MFDWQSLIKYVFEGFAVSIAMWLIAKKKVNYQEIVIIGLSAAATFAVLDQFSPLVSVGARQGSGFALGFQQVGLGDPEVEANGDFNQHSPQPLLKPQCQMVNQVCDYDPSVSMEDRSAFTCKEMDGQCTPM